MDELRPAEPGRRRAPAERADHPGPLPLRGVLQLQGRRGQARRHGRPRRRRAQALPAVRRDRPARPTLAVGAGRRTRPSRSMSAPRCRAWATKSIPRSAAADSSSTWGWSTRSGPGATSSGSNATAGPTTARAGRGTGIGSARRCSKASGWSLHRVWSTDWFHNPDRELRRSRRAWSGPGRAAGDLPPRGTSGAGRRGWRGPGSGRAVSARRVSGRPPHPASRALPMRRRVDTPSRAPRARAPHGATRQVGPLGRGRRDL